MENIRELISQPFLNRRVDRMDRVSYIHEMSSELRVARPQEIVDFIEEAQERRLVDIENDEIEANFDCSEYELIDKEDIDVDVYDYINEDLEEPIDNPISTSGEVINSLVSKHHIDPRIATSEVNKIMREEGGIDNKEDVISEIIE
jgi:hypothetical protein